MMGVATCCEVILSMCMYMHVCVNSKWITKVRSLPWCLSYEGRPDGLKASDARLEFETGHRYF